MTPHRFQTLDALRGVAILLVLVFHLRIASGAPALDRALMPLVDVGWVGVDLFFVLSGFLVGRGILADTTASDGFSRRRFFKRRILRLWPVLYLYLGMLALVGGESALQLTLPVMFHVQNFTTYIPSHLWSLAVEEHFYLAAALGLPPLLAHRGPNGVAAALVAILVGCLALRLAVLAAGVSPDLVQWQTQYRADSIAAGVLIAWVERYRPAWFAAALAQRPVCLAIAVAGFLPVAIVADVHWRYGIGLTLAWIASAALILGVHRAAVSSTLAGPARLLAWFGGISYSLYVWHVSLGRVADAVAPMFGLTGHSAMLLWRYVVAIAGATLVAVLVERPFMALRDVRPRIGWRDRRYSSAPSGSTIRS